MTSQTVHLESFTDRIQGQSVKAGLVSQHKVQIIYMDILILRIGITLLDGREYIGCQHDRKDKVPGIPGWMK